MNFLFFSAANTPLFSRDDAEQAEHTHEEMSLTALFPYDPDKVIQRGMRIGYTDTLGVFQVFEIRKAKTYEPDHYQEITAEHIAVAELTDEFFAATEWTEITAQAALTALLTGTLWSVGTVTASGTSSANIGNGNVWQDIRTIETNWNVTITPRITVTASGITGRYLDIASAGGTWRGLRLSLEKNLDDAAVTWDDSNVKTALYGFGKSVEVSGQTQPLTFADVVWAQTAEHPAKPDGQTYIEDPAATTAYGRNGRPRFGYYQNGDIDDAEVLLEKTWETLKTVNVPDVSIDGSVCDLHRLGFTDVPLRLHDLALVEIRPTGVTLQKEINRLTEDLLNPQSTRVNIGTYIPNIIYINRNTAQRAGGGGGSGGQSNAEYEDSKLTAEIQIGAGKITQIVTAVGDDGEVTAASICLAINNAGSSAKINADNIELNGNVMLGGVMYSQGGTLVLDSDILTQDISGSYIHSSLGVESVEYVKAGDYIQAGSGYLISGDANYATWQSVTVRSVTLDSQRYLLYTDSSTNHTPTGSIYGRVVTGYTDTTIYYLGHT